MKPEPHMVRVYDDTLWKRGQRVAIDDRCRLSSIVEVALREYLDRRDRQELPPAAKPAGKKKQMPVVESPVRPQARVQATGRVQDAPRCARCGHSRARHVFGAAGIRCDCMQCAAFVEPIPEETDHGNDRFDVTVRGASEGSDVDPSGESVPTTDALSDLGSRDPGRAASLTTTPAVAALQKLAPGLTTARSIPSPKVTPPDDTEFGF